MIRIEVTLKESCAQGDQYKCYFAGELRLLPNNKLSFDIPPKEDVIKSLIENLRLLDSSEIESINVQM